MNLFGLDVTMLDMNDEAEFLEGAEVYHRNERNGTPLMLLGEGLAVKCFLKKKGLLHVLRVITQSTKAHKQLKAVKMIMEIGLNSPKPIGVKVFDGKGKYEASFIYEFKENVKPLHEALQSSDRRALLVKLASDLALMYKAGVLFVDFHLGNVLVDESAALWWIDLECKYGKKKVESLFWPRMERMHRKCDQGVLSEQEWEFFKQSLTDCIEGTHS